MDQDIHWYLAERVIGARTFPPQLQRDLVAYRSRAVSTFAATLAAFRYVQAISEDESTQWRNRMLQALGVDPPGPPGSNTGQLIYLGEGEPPRNEPVPALVPQYPRSVVVPPNETEVCGGVLRVLEIDYDDSVTLVRWRIAPFPDVDTLFPHIAHAIALDTAGMDQWAIDHFGDKYRSNLCRHFVPAFSLDDDVATVYQAENRKSGAITSSDMSGITAFVPGTPSHATRLRLHWHGAVVTIALQP